MKTKPTTFCGLISSFGSDSAFADEMGIPPNTVKRMRHRNSIAVEHWPSLIRVCAKRGILFSMDDLVEMRTASRGGLAA